MSSPKSLLRAPVKPGDRLVCYCPPGVCQAPKGFSGPCNRASDQPSAPDLLAAAVKHLAALEEEAAANFALDNAEANFSNPAPERRRAARAMVAASVAGKELRAAIEAATTSAPQQSAEAIPAQEQAEALLTEIRTALNASGVWHLGMGTVDAIKALIAARNAQGEDNA